MAQTTERIELPQLKRTQIEIVLVGDTPLLCHRFPEKAKKEMLDKQMGKAKSGREAKNPQEQYESSLYKLPEGGYGFPTIAFKAAAVRAANDAGIAMTLARRSFHIMGELVTIEGEPHMREDIVRLGGPSRPTDIRFRGEFSEWRVKLNVVYNAGIISAEQLVNLLQIAGFGVGIGEWRPERNGVHGMFHVATEDEL